MEKLFFAPFKLAFFVGKHFTLTNMHTAYLVKKKKKEMFVALNLRISIFSRTLGELQKNIAFVKMEFVRSWPS